MVSQRITVFNGSPVHGAIDEYLATLAPKLTSFGHQVDIYALRDFHTKRCIGCFSCWDRTPGSCCLADDGVALRQAAINADILLLASPMLVGFVSALLKRTCDTLIPLLHPHTQIVQGETHHRKRYDRYPELALLLAPADDDTDDDIDIVVCAHRRLAINFHSPLRAWATVSQPVEDFCHALIGDSRLAARA